MVSKENPGLLRNSTNFYNPQPPPIGEKNGAKKKSTFLNNIFA